MTRITILCVSLKCHYTSFDLTALLQRIISFTAGESVNDVTHVLNPFGNLIKHGHKILYSLPIMTLLMDGPKLKKASIYITKF